MKVRGHLGVALVLALAAEARPQFLSEIGFYFAPWGLAPDEGPVAMTDDGEWVVFVDSMLSGCSGLTWERINMIRTDGTDFRVVVDWPALEALEPSWESRVFDMLVSGDGRWIVFSMPQTLLECNDIPPLHQYLVEVETGAVEELLWNGQVVGSVSFTDDGERMAFVGYDPVTDRWDFYIREDGITTKFLVTEPYTGPFGSASGKLSGDGSKFLFEGSATGICPCPTQMYVFDFATEVVTPLPSQDLFLGVGGFDISDDGSRAVYASGPIFGVNTDGSGYHQVATVGGASTTIAGDGSRVLHSFWAPPLYHAAWVPWEGGTSTIIPLYAGTVWSVPTDDTGTVIAGWDLQTSALIAPIAVWTEQSPILTSFGLGTPNSEFTFDVGGQRGDHYVLLASFAPGAVPLGSLGVLALDPGQLLVLATGSIPDDATQAQVTARVPPDLALLEPLPVHFQALVTSGLLSEGTLTNAPVFTLPVPEPAQEPLLAPDATRRSWGLAGERTLLDPVEQARRRVQMDPAVWWRSR